MTSTIGLLGFGFVLGLRHALDVDHLAAVAALVGGRRGLRSSIVAGTLWGLGHTVALVAVAAVVITLGVRVPPVVARTLELAVAAMLVVLGLRLLWTLREGAVLHAHAHAHGDRRHVHLHVHAPGARDDAHHHVVPAARGSLGVGLLHGLAGSAGLMLVVLATIPSPAVAIAWVLVFGCGSIVGMMAMSVLLGLPLVLAAAEPVAHVERALRRAAAVGSLVVGAGVAWNGL